MTPIKRDYRKARKPTVPVVEKWSDAYDEKFLLGLEAEMDALTMRMFGGQRVTAEESHRREVLLVIFLHIRAELQDDRDLSEAISDALAMAKRVIGYNTAYPPEDRDGKLRLGAWEYVLKKFEH